MKAIMISGKPKWSAKIANGDKKIEVRTSKALARAIQKLINEYGHADIYWYCTKDNKQRLYPVALLDKSNQVFKRAYREDKIDNRTNYLNGKVIFKFRCYKVEEIIFGTTLYNDLGFFTCNLHDFDLYKQSCLTKKEMQNYLKVKPNGLSGYAIHISDLEIFDEPKELSEFKVKRKTDECSGCKYLDTDTYEHCLKCEETKSLTKAPQNFCYVEVE